MKEMSNVLDSELIDALKSLKGNVNKVIAEIVLHLFEVDKRAIYRDAGYSSLFSYCTIGLGYSEGTAYRRIQAARAVNKNQEIYELLSEGKLSLCAVSEISKVIRPENKLELIESSIGKANLRLLCPAHNRLLAERTFGKEKIMSYQNKLNV